jgi:SAM-dependent methyltransferase
MHPLGRGPADRGDPRHPYDSHVGRYGAQLAAGLIEIADVRPGSRVLDVGCGTGQLTAELARVVGGAHVAAIDPGEAVVEVCRARVPEADVRIGSAEHLPFADAEFDAVLAQLVVNLVEDPPAAVAEMARVARADAVVSACIWDDQEMPLLRGFWDAAREVAPEALADVDARGQVGLPDPELLSELWQAAGLHDVALSQFEVFADYTSFDDLWAPFEAGVGNSGGVYTSLEPDAQAAVRASADRRLGSPDGSFRLTARSWAVRGTC